MRRPDDSEHTSAGLDRPRYIHALRFRLLNRLYDPLVRMTTKESEFKTRLVEQARVGAGRVLDLGSGTGTLSILLKQHYPEATVVGLDGDPEMLVAARRKAGEAGVHLDLHQGLADEVPFEDESFDVIVSSLLFHHLNRATKEKAFRETWRLLKPGGELHVVDWGRPHNVLMRLAFLGVQLLDGFATTSDNVRGKLVPMMESTGFESVEETRRRRTMFGTLSMYRARKT